MTVPMTDEQLREIEIERYSNVAQTLELVAEIRRLRSVQSLYHGTLTALVEVCEGMGEDTANADEYAALYQARAILNPKRHAADHPTISEMLAPLLGADVQKGATARKSLVGYAKGMFEMRDDFNAPLVLTDIPNPAALKELLAMAKAARDDAPFWLARISAAIAAVEGK